MNETIAVLWSESVRLVVFKNIPRWILCALFIGTFACLRVFAGPDPGITNASVVLFEGDQSAGITYQVPDGGPTTVLISNLSTSITPGPGIQGVQVSGSVTNVDVTAIIDSSVNILSSTNGVFVENGGGFAGFYQFTTNNFVYFTNVVNGTNVITSSNTFASGTGNVYTNVAPSGGATVVNAGTITTTGDNGNGILAESLPGTITLTLSNAPVENLTFGNAGPVSVFNSGQITTFGTNSAGILAQSIGGDGPESSPNSGNGGIVTVQTFGSSITNYGNGSYGIFAQSRGGNNGGGESGGAVHDGQGGGSGGDGGQVSVSGTGNITTYSDNAGGIFALSQAGNGGNGGNGGTLGGSGGSGGPGGKGSNVMVSGTWNIQTYGTNATAISAQSLGGEGGSGGDGSHFIDLGGGNGGGTGDGGVVTVVSGGTIQTFGSSSLGIFARSLGGFAGSGGNSYNPFYGDAGNGNSAGAGGIVNVLNTGDIMTHGDDSQAIYAESVGGGGGAAGSGGALVTLGSSGGAGGNASDVGVTNSGTLVTYGANSHGIEAQSLGGGGGDGGSSGGLVSLGGSGGLASTGAVVTVQNSGAIFTYGSNSYAILAQSIGGGGGNAGGDGGLVALGASGAGGGDGGNVNVSNSGQLIDLGTNSYGILAQSIGGGGGNGGGANGLAAIGGSGGTASQGHDVTVTNSGWINSTENAIFAQSIGGGGGNGGNSGGWISVGGNGAGGGNGGIVTVNNTGQLDTYEDNSSALLAQSVGGGGGNGGNSVAVGLAGAVAIGGSGGPGGNGGNVNVISGTNSIMTHGDNSYGIDAESVGGGGGNGGYAVSVAVGQNASASLAIGGSGGIGGSASNVTVTSASDIVTFGTNSHGVFAQSIGGGGGTGGFAVAASASSSASLSLAFGGSGGAAGNGGIVNLTNSGIIVTEGDHSYGVDAQSVGGGGGDGGFAIAASAAGGKGVAGSFSFGGSGGAGGNGAAVNLVNSGDIYTFGASSDAIMAQSLGGGGGSGGFSVSGELGGASLGGSFGGSGGGSTNGESGDVVSVFNSGQLVTFGDDSDGILAQSVGGGGGTGGFAANGSISKSASIGLSMGGSGGVGGSADTVTVTNTGAIYTLGNNSDGIFAQSLGGGGGNGGAAMAGSIDSSAGLSAALSIGGNGTNGGAASAVTVANSGSITTYGTNADGILAQSVGGGGGNGGLAAAGALGLGSTSGQLAVTIGGNGGTGMTAGAVTVFNSGTIETFSNSSIGILAQSIGGGGGNGGMSFSGSFSKGTAANVSVAIGGNGESGGDASSVEVDDSGAIFTDGDNAHGILAQSIGGGGGNGGLAAAIDLALGNTNGVNQFALAIGGKGADGGIGGSVTVRGTNFISTSGQDSYGIFAQSVGGGGGSGGFALAGTGVIKGTQGTNRSLTIALGGAGGNGNSGGTVTVDRAGDIVTSGDGSYGIVAQSIGGGGGDAGGARSFSYFTRGGGGNSQNSQSTSVNISVGGTGGTASDGGLVIVTNVGTIVTSNAGAYGIFAQSVGGGGGSGGDAHTSLDDLVPSEIPGLGTLVDKAVSTSTTRYQIDVGGSGGASGDGSNVLVNQKGDILTLGTGSYGIFAQSVGGGGGVGGNGTIGLQGQLGIGGSGQAAGNGGEVDVIYSGNLTTAGDGSAGIFAQSVGGGGGVAGDVDRGFKDAGLNLGKGLAFGGNGGYGGSGGVVNVISTGNITTGGNGADGIFAQSVGGGGGQVGDLGNDIVGGLGDFAGSVGYSGSGSDVTVSQTGNITTFGTNSTGIFAQSAGGTNGVGGNVSVTLNGNITVNGVDGDGICAQSGGGATVVTPPTPGPAIAVNGNATPINGNVTVTIMSNSVVQGGSGSGAGVRFIDGVNNTLDNYGTVTTVSGINGMAISATNANETINNFGTILGSVDLGSGTNGGANAFNNMAGAMLLSGSSVNIGASNMLVNSGIFSVGDSTSIQNTTLNGNFVQTTNGGFYVGLGGATYYDSLNVNGQATLNGLLSVYQFNNYIPIKGMEFTVLTATNINGQFSSFFDPLAGNYAINLRQIDSSTNVVLQVFQASFLPFAHTANQRAIAKNLNTFSGLGTTNIGDPRGATLINFLDTQDKGQLPIDFDLISPASLGAIFDLDFASVNQMSGNIQQRMSQIRAGNSEASGSLSAFDSQGNSIQLASTAPELPQMVIRTNYTDKWGFFASGNGQYVNVTGSTNAPGYHFESGGATLGVDKMLNPQTAVGVSFNYEGTKATLANNGNVDTDSGRLGLYGTWFDQKHYVESSMGGGYSQYSTERGALNGMASGNTDGLNYDAMLGAGCYHTAGKLLFGPYANVHYTYVRVSGFTETGSMAPLKIEDNDSQSFLTHLGARVAYPFLVNTVPVRPELQLAWQHECLDDSRAIASQFASGAGNVFTVHSPEFGRDSLTVDFWLSVQCTSRVSIFAGFHGDYLRTDYVAEGGNGGLTIAF